MSQELIKSARESVTAAEGAISRLNTQIQELRADISKTSDEARRKRLETLLKDVQALAARAQEQRSRALSDLERYGAKR